jgi:hypothetical protein
MLTKYGSLSMKLLNKVYFVGRDIHRCLDLSDTLFVRRL